MRTITKLLIIIFAIFCLCYYYEIDIMTAFGEFFQKDSQAKVSTSKDIQSETYNNIPNTTNNSSVNTNNNTNSNNINTNNGTSTVVIPENKENKPVEDKTPYKEIVEFLIGQKKDKKLIESYRMADKGTNVSLKGRSFAADNGLAVIALSSTDTEEARGTAEDILKNLASVQNKDGSWYDFYDVSGQTVKVSGKGYTRANTGNNALVLYAYSYYAIMTGDNQFKDIMKKSANFVLSRGDEKTEGLYDYEVGAKGIRTLKGNVYSYFGLREYAMANAFSDYQEFKDKLSAADRVASFVINNCMDKGVFINGYNGKDKDTASNIDTHILGSILARSSKQGEKIKYQSGDFENLLSKLYKNFSGLEGYRIDVSDKNKGFIWCEGTSKVPVAFLKLGNKNRSNDVLGFIEKYKDIVPKSFSIRGIPYSTNVDKNIDMTGSESVSASSWAVIAYKCYYDEHINNILFGREEDVFKAVVRE